MIFFGWFSKVIHRGMYCGYLLEWVYKAGSKITQKVCFNEQPRDSIQKLLSHILLLQFFENEFFQCCNINEPPHDKTNKMTVCPGKTQISLGISPAWSESSLCAQWVAKDPTFLHADSKDSDQTGRMPRLIWVFAGHTLILLVLSCRGSFYWCRFKALINRPGK